VVAIDTATGTPVRVVGAALVGGPVLNFVAGAPAERLRRIAALEGAGLTPRGTLQPPVAAPPPGPEPVPGAAQLPSEAARQAARATWATPAFFAGAPYGPPYELPSEVMAWMLSAETQRLFKPVDRAARITQQAHEQRSPPAGLGPLLASVYGMVPPPSFLALAVDVTA